MKSLRGACNPHTLVPAEAGLCGGHFCPLPHSLGPAWKDLKEVFWAVVVIEALPLTSLAASPVWLLLFFEPPAV